MGGPRGCSTRLFTFLPLTTSVNSHRFRITANLFIGTHSKVFRGSVGPAGTSWTLAVAVALHRFSLSSLLNCPVNCSNWSDPVGGCFQMCESVVRRRGGGVAEGNMSTRSKDTPPLAAAPTHRQRESFPTLKPAARFPFHICFSCKWQI